MRLGQQVDIKGIVAGTPDADRAVRYLTKYLTKAVAETYADGDGTDAAYEDHIDRLHDEVRWLPCSRECANWLRFGVQPRDAGPGLIPGHCASKSHDREHLGVGGRRVLVSRGWSGKTLTEHKADRAAVVRAALEAAEIDTPAADRMAAETLHDDGQPRFVGRTCPSPNMTTPASSWPPSSRPAAGVRSTTERRPCWPAPIHLWTAVRQPTHRCRPRPEQRRQS